MTEGHFLSCIMCLCPSSFHRQPFYFLKARLEPACSVDQMKSSSHPPGATRQTEGSHLVSFLNLQLNPSSRCCNGCGLTLSLWEQRRSVSSVAKLVFPWKSLELRRQRKNYPHQLRKRSCFSIGFQQIKWYQCKAYATFACSFTHHLLQSLCPAFLCLMKKWRYLTPDQLINIPITKDINICTVLW